jgi:hypothetical protein
MYRMGHTFSHAVQKSIMYAPAQTSNLISYTLKIYIAYAVWPKPYIFCPEEEGHIKRWLNFGEDLV